jgi:hypothetical protein
MFYFLLFLMMMFFIKFIVKYGFVMVFKILGIMGIVIGSLVLLGNT